jgi:hypothetical protein
MQRVADPSFSFCPLLLPFHLVPESHSHRMAAARTSSCHCCERSPQTRCVAFGNPRQGSRKATAQVDSRFHGNDIGG